jgi:hypothetical protein
VMSYEKDNSDLQDRRRGRAFCGFGGPQRIDLSGLTPVRFEFEKKTAQLNMRLPKSLLEAVKKRSSARGIPYTRFIRKAVEMAVAPPPRKPR